MYLDHIAQIDVSHKAPQEQRSRYHNLLYQRSVDEDRQAPPLSTRPGYQEAQTASVEMQRQSRQDLGFQFFRKSERKLLNDQLDPWLSTKLGRVLHRRTRTPNRIFLFSVVFNILVERTIVVFELERMASTYLAG